MDVAKRTALARLIHNVAKLHEDTAWDLTARLNDADRDYLWAIFYNKRYDEFRKYIKQAVTAQAKT